MLLLFFNFLQALTCWINLRMSFWKKLVNLKNSAIAIYVCIPPKWRKICINCGQSIQLDMFVSCRTKVHLFLLLYSFNLVRSRWPRMYCNKWYQRWCQIWQVTNEVDENSKDMFFCPTATKKMYIKNIIKLSINSYLYMLHNTFSGNIKVKVKTVACWKKAGIFKKQWLKDSYWLYHA